MVHPLVDVLRPSAVRAGTWRSLQQSAHHPAKLAFPRSAFVHFIDMFDAIFKLTVPLREFCGHYVNSRQRILPARRGVSDALAEDELMGHVFREVYSMTSSARASNEGGTVRPSALAVLRLITSSNFVGACTGRSAGVSPLRMRSTYPAERRNWST